MPLGLGGVRGVLKVHGRVRSAWAATLNGTGDFVSGLAVSPRGQKLRRGVSRVAGLVCQLSAVYAARVITITVLPRITNVPDGTYTAFLST